MKFIIAALALMAFIPAHAEESVQEKNKRIVTEFYDLAFNQHQPLEAANKYLADNYKQHNPYVAEGKKGFIDAFAGDTLDDSVTDFKRFIAENDLVVVHSHGKKHQFAFPLDRGVAVIDIFRVEGNLIIEHWDVGQKVPETSKNDNTMF